VLVVVRGELAVFVLLPLELALHLLGGELHGGSHGVFLARFGDGFGSAEVNDFGVEVPVDHDVFGLEVVVSLADLVQVRVGNEDLRHEHARGGFAEAVLGGEDEVEELASGAELHNVEVVPGEFVHLDDVGVVELLELVQHEFLAEDVLLLGLAAVFLYHPLATLLGVVFLVELDLVDC